MSMEPAATTKGSGRAAGVRHVVLDAGGIINGISLRGLNAATVQFYTIPEVIEEIRDTRSRAALAAFPFDIIEKAPSGDAMRFIAQFSKTTGDFYALSATDLKVLSLAYHLEVETHGKENVRESPASTATQDEERRLQTAKRSAKQRKKARPQTPFVECTIVRPFVTDELLFQPADEYAKATQAFAIKKKTFLEALRASFPAPVSTATPSTPHVSKQEILKTQGEKMNKKSTDNASSKKEEKEEEKKTGNKAQKKELSGAELMGDNNDGEGEWITPENIAMHGMKTTGGPKRVISLSKVPSSVACVTTDFTMQNVMLQIGLRLLSVHGMSISSVMKWVQRCHACMKHCPDMSKEFCPHCGNHTLVRQSVRVSGNGKVTYSGGAKAVFNTRGSKFSLAKPKGGRHNTDIILREDQLLDQRRYRDKAPEAFEDAVEFGFTKVKAAAGGKKYGVSGNPNQVKHREGRKRRGRRKK